MRNSDAAPGATQSSSLRMTSERPVRVQVLSELLQFLAVTVLIYKGDFRKGGFGDEFKFKHTQAQACL